MAAGCMDASRRFVLPRKTPCHAEKKAIQTMPATLVAVRKPRESASRAKRLSCIVRLYKTKRWKRHSLPAIRYRLSSRPVRISIIDEQPFALTAVQGCRHE